MLRDAYFDLEVGMQQHLELEALLALVLHVEHGLQAVLRERHAVDQPKVVAPCLLRICAELCGRQTEIKLHTVVTSLCVCSRL